MVLELPRDAERVREFERDTRGRGSERDAGDDRRGRRAEPPRDRDLGVEGQCPATHGDAERLGVPAKRADDEVAVVRPVAKCPECAAPLDAKRWLVVRGVVRGVVRHVLGGDVPRERDPQTVEPRTEVG
jgi:hypothetical protein